jgi:hypothetical protein
MGQALRGRFVCGTTWGFGTILGPRLACQGSQVVPKACGGCHGAWCGPTPGPCGPGALGLLPASLRLCTGKWVFDKFNKFFDKLCSITHFDIDNSIWSHIMAQIVFFCEENHKKCRYFWSKKSTNVIEKTQ